jgi:hypothetical protein
MIELLTLLLRIAGAGLLVLAVLHVPIGKQLKWSDNAKRMSPVNASIFHVHTFFICVVLVMMGLSCLLEPDIFLIPSRAGLWLAWSISAFWMLRLYFQWFVYPAALWRGKRMETAVHAWFTLVWAALAALYAACGMHQSGWLLSL